MIDRGKLNLLGVKIDAVDYDGALQKIMNAAHSRTPFGVSALAVHGVMTGVLDQTHRYRLNRLEMIVPDGQPVRWGLNLLHGAALSDRVYGPNLMLKTCERAANDNVPIFLFGGSKELLAQLAKNLRHMFPNLHIAGARASKFRKLEATEKTELVEEIKKSGARITFVGLGCPRQEVWAYEFKNEISMPVLAVGAAFSFHAGILPQAPQFMQKAGLEWLFRFCREPLRLWKRYVLLNPLFLSLLFLQWSRIKSFDSVSTSPPKQEVLYG